VTKPVLASLLLLAWPVFAGQPGKAGSKHLPDQLPHDVQTGDWIRFRVRLPVTEARHIEIVEKQTVLSITGKDTSRTATLRRWIENGGNTDSVVVKRPVAPARPPIPDSGKKVTAQEKIRIGTTLLSCHVHEETRIGASERKWTIRTWRCDRVPLGGVVRIEHDEKAVYELLEFGRGR